MAWDAPWVYVQQIETARCDIYRAVFYGALDHIHTNCRRCWKVVVRPRNLVELFDLYELQKTMGVPCKCGVEHRKTVPGLYGGYFYTRSKEEGLERYKQVRELVDQELSPKVDVILKRYCTEFEIGGEDGIKGQGPTNLTLETTQEERDMEEYIEAQFPKVGYGNPQPKFLIADVMLEWIHFAYKNGDKTYKKFTGGSPLYPSAITYHEEIKPKTRKKKSK